MIGEGEQSLGGGQSPQEDTQDPIQSGTVGERPAVVSQQIEMLKALVRRLKPGGVQRPLDSAPPVEPPQQSDSPQVTKPSSP